MPRRCRAQTRGLDEELQLTDQLVRCRMGKGREEMVRKAGGGGELIRREVFFGDRVKMAGVDERAEKIERPSESRGWARRTLFVGAHAEGLFLPLPLLQWASVGLTGGAEAKEGLAGWVTGEIFVLMTAANMRLSCLQRPSAQQGGWMPQATRDEILLQCLCEY